MGDRSQATGQPEETVLQQITRTYYELLPAFERHMGVTRARWHLLKQLFSEAQLSQTALQQRAGVDGAAVTRQMKQLEEAGIVTRWVDPRDNRFTLVALTPEGRQLVARLMERRAVFEADVMAGIDPSEIAIMQRGLSQVRANLAALAHRASSQPSDSHEHALSRVMSHQQQE
jgi:DNA-binding MarR family transcriptional regulator